MLFNFVAATTWPQVATLFLFFKVWSNYGVVIKPDLTQCIHNAAL